MLARLATVAVIAVVITGCTSPERRAELQAKIMEAKQQRIVERDKRELLARERRDESLREIWRARIAGMGSPEEIRADERLSDDQRSCMATYVEAHQEMIANPGAGLDARTRTFLDMCDIPSNPHAASLEQWYQLQVELGAF